MPGLLRGVARTAVVAGTATAVSNRVSRRQAGRWAQQEQFAQDQSAYQQDVTYQPQATAPDMDARIDQLRKLSDLKAQGILSEAEFEAQKARILGL